MKIEFYEEFPSKGSLEKLKLIKFPSKLFIAAKSIEEFKKYEKIAKSYKKNIKIAYWPIIKNSYWISPFSNTKNLIELFNELKKINNPLLIDLELPLRSKWKMYIKNIFSFRKNKKLIKNFLEKNKRRITTAEYPFAFVSRFMKFLGLNYNINYERSIMWYSSMLSEYINNKVKKNLAEIKDKSNYSISLGTITKGILGNEPIISPENIERDLEFVKKSGFNKVVIFRLGGLNKDYVRVLNRFI